MILDSRIEPGRRTLATPLGTTQIGDVIDTRLAGGETDVGLWLVIAVATTVTSGGAATVSFELASDAQAVIAIDGSATTHFRTGAIPLASLTAGRRIAAVQLPLRRSERYIGLLQSNAGAALTGGEVSMFITPDLSDAHQYRDASN